MSDRGRRCMAGLFLLLISVLVLLTGLNHVPVPDGPSSIVTGWKLDLATATSSELQLLPGIGPVLANRIIAWRIEGGILEGIEDLRHIQGIGPRTISNLQPLVSVTASSSPGEFKNED